jgi:hypothetical protein
MKVRSALDDVEQLCRVATRWLPDRFGSALKQRGQWVVDCTLVNFDTHLEKFASRQIETCAEVPIRIPHVPRPLFGLSRSRESVLSSIGSPTSGSHSSTNIEPIRVEFEAFKSGQDRQCFGPLC